MIGIQDISNINSHYVFYKNDIREEVTNYNVSEIINQALEDINFYNRAIKEIQIESEKQKEYAESLKCPTVDDIVNANNLFTQCELEARRENASIEWNKFSGMLTVSLSYYNKLYHAEKILREAKAVIKKI